jgi:hypothetical protein
MKVGIICCLDGAANSVRPLEIKKFLAARGHGVELIDTNKLDLEARWLCKKAKLRNLFLSGKYKCNRTLEKARFQGEALARQIGGCGFDVVICEVSEVAAVLTRKLGCLKIFDCPTPWTAELRESPEFGMSPDEIDELEVLEREVYASADYVAFHWHTYADYVRKHLYDGGNIITLNWGCHPKAKRVRFRNPPKIVFLGKLYHSWVDVPLLERLVTAGGNIDVYGIPEPESKEQLNYKGYAEPDVLVDYQFGLVTIARSAELKCRGFSAKHVEYASYGLPVLEPEWRDIPGLTETSIPYNEDNFLEQVRRYSDPDLWQEKSDEAYELAKSLDWNITLQPLADIIG